MQITTAVAFLLVGAAAASNITYNVVSFLPSNQTLGVVVDNNVYPLTATNENTTLLHMGDAPAATSGYKYAILDKNSLSVIEQENFTRSPVAEGKTLNEYYNRSWNTMNLTQLPTIMDPIPAIHRIETNLHVDGEIPTIHITGSQEAIDAMHKNSTAEIDVSELKMVYINPRDVKTFDNVTLAIAGFSSRSFPKLSYKLKIPKESGDLYDYRRFKLRAMAVDPSYMKEELSYAICDSIGMPCPKYSYVRLFINEEPLGLFGFADNLKNPWPRNEFGNGNKKYKQGALYYGSPNKGAAPQQMGSSVISDVFNDTAAVNNTNGPASVPNNFTSDLSYLGDNLTLYMLNYKIHEDPSKGSANYTRIMDLTKFISEQPSTTSDDSAVALWNEKMDVTSFLRGLALEILVSDSDGYIANANNFILYDDLESERLIFSGQDFDLAMGVDITGMGTVLYDGNYTNFPNLLARPLTTRMLAVPEFKKELDNLIRNITEQLVNRNVMGPRIDSLYTFLEQDVAWDKTCNRTNPTSAVANAGGFSMDSIPFMFGVNGTFPEAISKYSISLMSWLDLRSNGILEYFKNQTNTNTTTATA